jgi:hypothetical protein
MRQKPTIKELEKLLKEILDQDAKQRVRSRRTIPAEVAEAMNYFVLWGRARTRAEALLLLARPLANEVIDKVRAVSAEAAAMTQALPEPKRGRKPRKPADA